MDSDAAAAEGFCTPLALWNFVARIETGYNDNPYHNFSHAVDVTHTVYRYVTITEPRTHVTHVEKFALLVAAPIADLDHPGVNNAFLVNTKDRLATLYNDSSVSKATTSRSCTTSSRLGRPGTPPWRPAAPGPARCRGDTTSIEDSNTPLSRSPLCVSSSPECLPRAGRERRGEYLRRSRRLPLPRGPSHHHRDCSSHRHVPPLQDGVPDGGVLRLHSEGIAATPAG